MNTAVQPPAAAPAVLIEGLWSVFRSAGRDAVIHQDLSLRIEAGEVLAIVGGSGSGNSGAPAQATPVLQAPAQVAQTAQRAPMTGKPSWAQ